MNRRAVKAHSWLGAALVVTGIFSSGCGGGGNEKHPPLPRVTASGKVTVDGSPLSSGTISFGGAVTGTTATGTISNGAYSIGASKGPNPGNNSVSISSGTGADNWVWINSKVEVGEKGYTGDFEVKSKETKKVQRIKDE